MEETKKPKEASRKSKSGAAGNVEEEKKFEHPPPKNAPSAYINFNTAFCKKFVEDGGEYKLAFTAAGAKWSSMNEEEKQPFVDM